jgi:hypothetical protein
MKVFKMKCSTQHGFPIYADCNHIRNEVYALSGVAPTPKGLLYMSSGRGGGGRGGGGGGGRGGGRGRGRMGGFGVGPGGSCVCPNCGYSTSHVIGTPCYQQTCPKCGSRMTRGS